MSSLGWGRLYGVEIEQINADHRIISNLLIQLDDAIETDQSRDIVANIVSVIVEFTYHHLRRENDYWAGHDHPPSQDHTHDHVQMVAELESMLVGWQNGEWTIAQDLKRIRPLLDVHICNVVQN